MLNLCTFTYSFVCFRPKFCRFLVSLYNLFGGFHRSPNCSSTLTYSHNYWYWQLNQSLSFLDKFSLCIKTTYNGCFERKIVLLIQQIWQVRGKIENMIFEDQGLVKPWQNGYHKDSISLDRKLSIWYRKKL